MFLLDKPYVSEFLKQSVVASQAPVLDNDVARAALVGTNARLCPPEEFTRLAQSAGCPRIYSNSENAIGWIAENLADTKLPGYIELFKDKLRFRELIQDLYPDFWFKGVSLDELASLDPATLPFPLILKPAVGFFSLGVRMLAQAADWAPAIQATQAEVEAIRRQYPRQVLDLDRFILEALIPGEEYAVDAYYDCDGQPVILNILGHLFASEKDVSDRVYITSGPIIRRLHEPFAQYLTELGARANIKNFPVHVELRVDANGHVAPIEVNPMRFAGWCCTDIAHFAYGLNPYTCYLNNHHPDWDAILASREGKAWAIVVADLPPGLDRQTIQAVDYPAFASHFTQPLELRRIDYHEYSVFAFLFAQVQQDDLSELTSILQSDLTEYLRF